MSDDAMRPTDRGPIAAALVRDFIAKALAHEAVADEVAELLYTYLAHDDRDSEVLARPLRGMIVEIIDHAATDEDWHAVCAQLVANACDALELASAEPPADQNDSLHE
ncbi:MAG TPA: hypothetical protein VN544_10660 [Gaiellaceae bacterium]|nr:hypothetical protein [Gaiellaceae bacterium]